jgi:hypothetical protein
MRPPSCACPLVHALMRSPSHGHPPTLLSLPLMGNLSPPPSCASLSRTSLSCTPPPSTPPLAPSHHPPTLPLLRAHPPLPPPCEHPLSPSPMCPPSRACPPTLTLPWPPSHPPLPPLPAPFASGPFLPPLARAPSLLSCMLPSFPALSLPLALLPFPSLYNLVCS